MERTIGLTFKCVIFQSFTHLLKYKHPPKITVLTQSLTYWWGFFQAAPNQTIVVVQRHLADLGMAPATTHCNTCNLNVTTIVDDSLRDFGWIWCLLCSCFFSWIVGCLACCLKGFKQVSKCSYLYKKGKTIT